MIQLKKDRTAAFRVYSPADREATLSVDTLGGTRARLSVDGLDVLRLAKGGSGVAVSLSGGASRGERGDRGMGVVAPMPRGALVMSGGALHVPDQPHQQGVQVGGKPPSFTFPGQRLATSAGQPPVVLDTSPRPEEVGTRG